MINLAEYIDHTLLKPNATSKEIITLCDEAIKFNFKAVCVNGCHLELAKKQLQGHQVKIAAVVGFPLGAMSTESKIYEVKDAIRNGADEIDMVLNIGWLKEGATALVEAEIAKIKAIVGTKVLKVILETCYLTDKEKRLVCRLVVNAGADFVKTSTGFGTAGATFDDVTLMKSIVKNKAFIKASGGIRDRETALKYIELGASRIGTSQGPALIRL